MGIFGKGLHLHAFRVKLHAIRFQTDSDAVPLQVRKQFSVASLQVRKQFSVASLQVRKQFSVASL